MAATYIGQSPITAVSYEENLDGGITGTFAEVWQSDAVSPDARLQEIITATEQPPYNHIIGNSFTSDPFQQTVIVGRRIQPMSDDDWLTHKVFYTLGPKVKKTIETTADWVYSFSSSLSAGQTNIDKNGDFITVGTITDSGDPAPTTPPYTTVPQTGANVEKMFPSVRISARGVLLANPFADFQEKIGTLNSSSMTVDGQTLAEGTTMLVNASVQTPDDGGRYVVNYEFEYRKDPLDWYAVVVAIDPKTGKPYQGIAGTEYNAPANTTKGVINVSKGSVGFAMYEDSDLGSLITV